MPIVTANGVVGRIIRTGQKFSDVHLLSDPNFNIDILYSGQEYAEFLEVMAAMPFSL